MDTHRSILHVDMNCFYASVEMAENPRLRGKPVIVGGDEKSRHGIVLTASYPAKRRGVKTAMTLNEARRICPEAIIVPPQYGLYIAYSKKARAIYNQYTDLVEPFGLDEAWLDITDSVRLAGNSPLLVAQEISERIPMELGCTVSVGLSWNKIFAKMGSDYNKPDGLTVITPQNMTELVWPAKVRDLPYVGPATERKLHRNGIFTIGQLALADDYAMRRLLGKMGEVIQSFARGLDTAPVREYDPELGDIVHEIKGIGNGITTPFDVEDERTACQVIWLMGESVAQRLRAHGLAARTISAYARDAQTLSGRSTQATLPQPTQLTREICKVAAALVCDDWDFAHGEKARALGVHASNLSPARTWVQLDVFGNETQRQRELDLDKTIDSLRLRFGNHAVRRLSELCDPKLAIIDAERDNIVHPVSYFA
ncbi:MAG: DNA polymerase IV [Coriobacteriales bacterium]|nr:DNA polymerase IV [Coriobacteriales bacterium]